eukprot:CAMPEP_0204050124 /NCGR_PEP_ID=MMETSP0360-20130528/119718_1 /ASSEMBLY_ACC=CAM_ASM_000342 /TAXON_ID=268821 /ORGANISM="Scrippsiella Hangoei, Strain SHTV-5" /LENGTH=66 /DNA_ID=CAMNT_0050997061 /DNA_START=317 /DNA_END=513 /DNA_ORIENTATION=+
MPDTAAAKDKLATTSLSLLPNASGDGEDSAHVDNEATEMSVGAAADPSAPPAKARGGVPAAFFRLS